MEAAALGLLRLEEVLLGNCHALLYRVQVIKEPEFNLPLKVHTLSPISISTGRKEGTKFHKLFLSPTEPDFGRALKENLKRKYLALYEREPEGEVEFTFLKPFRSRLLKVANTEIRGWEMRLIMSGDSELLCLGYQWGLGEHNGSGFGMIAIST